LRTHKNGKEKKKYDKGTLKALLSLIEPFQPIAAVVVCCRGRQLLPVTFFFFSQMFSRSSMAIYSFLSEPVTHFLPPF
jgi:hypothetical protein